MVHGRFAAQDPLRQQPPEGGTQSPPRRLRHGVWRECPKPPRCRGEACPCSIPPGLPSSPHLRWHAQTARTRRFYGPSQGIIPTYADGSSPIPGRTPTFWNSSHRREAPASRAPSPRCSTPLKATCRSTTDKPHADTGDRSCPRDAGAVPRNRSSPSVQNHHRAEPSPTLSHHGGIHLPATRQRAVRQGMLSHHPGDRVLDPYPLIG